LLGRAERSSPNAGRIATQARGLDRESERQAIIILATHYGSRSTHESKATLAFTVQGLTSIS